MLETLQHRMSFNTSMHNLKKLCRTAFRFLYLKSHVDNIGSKTLL